MQDPSANHPESKPEPASTIPLGLEACLEAFCAVAPVAHPREILNFLKRDGLQQQINVAWELIKVDLCESIKNGIDRWIEDYCDAMPSVLTVDRVPIDLVWEEQQARVAAGQACDLDEYCLRFPHLQAVLDQFALSTDPDAANVKALSDEDRIDEFVILKLLGEGAFAQVYLARQETMQRLVALKLASRIGDEPQALARLDHPSIVRVFDQRTRDEEPRDLIYMEYVPCGTLADAIKSVHAQPISETASVSTLPPPETREEIFAQDSSAIRSSSGYRATKQLPDGRPLLRHLDQKLVDIGQVAPENSSTRQWIESADWPATVAWIGHQLASALDYAHQRNVFHRDVKPANVLLTAEGIPKLADFNVSVAQGDQNADANANFGGSLAYMAPEHLLAASPDSGTSASDLDGRADLYALAIVLWELWQGERPWELPQQPGSFLEATKQQLELRKRELQTPPSQKGTGRALGQVLLSTLQWDRDLRPASGAALAARLRLCLFPESAPIFHPHPGGFRDRLLKLPVWLVTGCIILVPNAAAGAFNYWYNETHILHDYKSIGIKDTFEPLAITVNAIAYPIGVFALVWFSGSIAKGLAVARTGRHVPEHAIRSAWRLGLAAAMIGGTLWGLAGMIYPIVLKICHPEFTWEAATAFFLSLVLCGAVAWTFPFFGGTAVGVLLYYPVLIAPTMRDSNFKARIAALKKLGGRFLIGAAMVPLLAAALVSDQRNILLVTLAATGVGIFVSFFAYQRFEDAFRRLTDAITEKQDVVD